MNCDEATYERRKGMETKMLKLLAEMKKL